jgi:high-affinity Fe2+/Pb2+ permease
MHEAFPEDYDPTLNTDPLRYDTFTAAIGAVLAVVVALVLGITIYFWSH